MDILAAIKREERKLEAARQVAAPAERSASGCKSFGRFNEQGNQSRKKARLVSGCKS
jgi:hypothetical protein